jgi:hypothetical protein
MTGFLFQSTDRLWRLGGRVCLSLCVIVSLVAFQAAFASGIAPSNSIPSSTAKSFTYTNSNAGQILREVRCKVLIRAGVSAQVGDVLPVIRKTTGSPQGTVLGQVRLRKFLPNRITADVVEPRSDCRKLVGGFVLGQATFVASPTSSLSSAAAQKQGVKGPPPPLRALFSAGPGLVSTTLKGISRATVVETYPLLLSAINLSTDVFPFAFSSDRASQVASGAWPSILGVEGNFRFVTSLNDVRVSVPSLLTGEEVDLDMRVNRITGRGGLLVRYPLWKGRLFADARTGYFAHRFLSGLIKFNTAENQERKPFELSPLRDLSLSGLYTLGGFQFQPVDKFRARLNVGTLMSTNYQLDNRTPDAPLDAQSVSTRANQPSLFILEASLNYLFSRLQIGLDLSVESFSGRAIFPDGKNEGVIAEVYTAYGLNVAFLL